MYCWMHERPDERKEGSWERGMEMDDCMDKRCIK